MHLFEPKKSDEPRLVELLKNVIGSLEPDLPEDEIVSECHRFIDTTKIVVYGENHQYVGVIAYKPNESTQKIHISLLGVDSTKRGKGYGDKLLEEFIKHCKTLGGYKYIIVGTAADNRSAINLYTKHGFRQFFTGKEEHRSFVLLSRRI